MTYTCEQCNAAFSSNFTLYNHKISNHGPVVGIVTKSAPEPPRVNKVADNPERYKRYRSEHNDPNPSKYRKVYEGDQEDKGEKRSRSENSEEDAPLIKKRKTYSQGVKRKGKNYGWPPSKYRKVQNQGQKHDRFSSSDDSSAPESKYRKIEQRGTKRYYSSDSDDDVEPSPKYKKKFQQGLKRQRQYDSDDEFPAKYSRIHSDDPEVLTLKRLLANTRRRNTILGKQNKECEERIKELQRQIDEVQNYEGDYELTDTINSVINDVTIHEFNKIRELMERDNIDALLRSSKHVSNLKKLFLGLSWGIVPITAPQRIVLSDLEKNLIRNLKDATNDDVRKQIRANKQAFIHLFEVIKDSIELVVNSYNRSK